MTLPDLLAAAARLSTPDLDDLIEALLGLRNLRDPDPNLEPEEDADVEDDVATLELMEPEDRRTIAARTTGLSDIDP